MNNTENLCLVPWLQTTIQTNGQFAVCCQIFDENKRMIVNDQDKVYSAIDSNPSDFRNSEHLKQIRKKMLDGEFPVECGVCKDEENLNLKSKRITFNNSFKDQMQSILHYSKSDGTIDTNNIPLKAFDIRLGNNCNLKCRYCSPLNSSSWVDDYIKVNFEESQIENDNLFYDYSFRTQYPLVKKTGQWTIDSKDLSWYENSNFLKQLDELIEDKVELYFTGGEPTLIKAHWELLEKLVQSNKAKSIRLIYHTNTTLINDQMIEIWSHFNQVSVGCSIDAINELTHYLRPPVKWAMIEKNLAKFNELPKNMGTFIAITVSVFNVLNIIALIHFLLKNRFFHIDLHFVKAPEYYNAQILPPKAKDFVIEKYNTTLEKSKYFLSKQEQQILKNSLFQIIEHLKLSDKSELIHEFYQQTEKLDKIRNQSFYASAPQIHQLLQMK